MPDWKKIIIEQHDRHHKDDSVKLIQGAPCAQEDIARLEETIGLKMPSEFKDLYSAVNGFGSHSGRDDWFLVPVEHIPQVMQLARNWFSETHPELAARFFPFIDWSCGDYTGYLVSESGMLEKGLHTFGHEEYEFDASQESDVFLYPSGFASIEDFIRI